MVLENIITQSEVIVFPVLIAIIAYLSKALDGGGSLIMAFLGILVYHASGRFFFWSLIIFLALGSVFTKFKQDYKAEIGMAEKGGRSINPVLANGIIPAFMAVLGNPFYFISSTSAALADTLASELGCLYSKPRSITSFEEVEPGTTGAISPLGQLAAVLGAVIMGVVGVILVSVFEVQDPRLSMELFIENPWLVIFISTIAGFFGCQIDSFLGGTLDFLSKEEINLLGTLSGAVLSIVLYLLII